ncbi:MAG: glycosyltransferase [Vulcanimicrobiaceae bacterium]
MKLLIGIPTAGSPSKPFLDSLAALQLPQAVTSIERKVVTGNFVPGQREMILRDGLRRNADLIAMVDDDMVLPPDALIKLHAALASDKQIGVAGALYYARDGLRPMAVAAWDERRTTSSYIPAFDGKNATDVDGVGFGCALVRVEALRDLGQPFMRAQIYVEERAGRVRICNEDYLLCASLRRAGIRVVLHSGVKCGHFDRATGRVFPERWEDAGETSSPRMIVQRPDGSQVLAPFDSSVQEANEKHVTAELDYIFADEGGL